MLMSFPPLNFKYKSIVIDQTHNYYSDKTKSSCNCSTSWRLLRDLDWVIIGRELYCGKACVDDHHELFGLELGLLSKHRVGGGTKRGLGV